LDGKVEDLGVAIKAAKAWSGIADN